MIIESQRLPLITIRRMKMNNLKEHTGLVCEHPVFKKMEYYGKDYEGLFANLTDEEQEIAIGLAKVILSKMEEEVEKEKTV